MQVFTIFSALSVPLAWASPQLHRKHVDFTVGQIVETSSGPVAGHGAANHSEVSEYLGIPFGQAPVGDLRFAAPVKYTGSSMLNGSIFVGLQINTSSLTPADMIQGPSCLPLPSSPQTSVTASQIAASNITTVGLELIEAISNPPDVVYGEDCLYLNVWSKPQCGERQKAVMVFIHGGGFDGGTSSSPMLSGASLADHEDVIVVSLK